MGTVIRVENLSKKYAIGAQESKRDNLREVIIDTFAAPFRRLRSGGGTEGNDQDFWALKDVSFDVQEGEVVGVIGRNGAGKSTLLKILSKITEPTSGSVKIKGRVASLLEVGTGFHPELTGRENIYLNGAILGMTRNEINSKFDEIVEFSEIEKFLDTPVKRYSSGMYVRLAFAVAAHLDPEILIVDEVLAVGDAQFQRKCLGKMGDVSRVGKTVLFVSHNMKAISELCNRGIFLKGGMIECVSDVDEAINKYYQKQVVDYSKQGVTISSYVEGNEENNCWKKGDFLTIDLVFEKKINKNWLIDVAGYTTDDNKVFAIEGKYLSLNQVKSDNKITILIENIGYACRDLKIDIGIRERENEPFFLLIQDVVMVKPSSVGLPIYKRTDVFTVPIIYCQ